MKELRGMTLSELESHLISIGEKKFRAKQIYEWVTKGTASFDDMSNVSKGLREQLITDTILKNVTIIESLKSADGTMKCLNQLQDGHVVESVFMTYKHGNSACISTQVGCKMKCSFCASTLNGVARNLTAGEMIGQIYELQNTTGKRISNLVLMGSGEPLDNYDEVVKFIRLATDEKGLNMSARNITLSTCGIAPKIKDLAMEGFPITLAISLHNPFEEERIEVMPITKRYGLNELFEAVDDYIQKTNRRVTFEYALIDGINDTDRHAEALGKRLKGKLVHVNLIPVNAVKEKDYHPTSNVQINRFKTILMDKYKVNTTVRRELGSDINAACGQLRNQHIEGNVSTIV